jgi:hypothetical protein
MDNSLMERRADQYANHLLIGSDNVPDISGPTFKDLARQAKEIETRNGADASRVILEWARRNQAYDRATLALRALYRTTGARRKLRQLFELHVDIESATDTDHSLLRCVYGESESD